MSNEVSHTPISSVKGEDELRAWSKLISVCYAWAWLYMDQWEKVTFTTPDGRVIYLTISGATDHPESFDRVDGAGMFFKKGPAE